MADGRPKEQGAAKARKRKPARSVLRYGLSHGLRRQILRVLMESNRPLSSVELSRTWIEASLTTVAHHIRVLKDLGAIEVVGTRRTGGSIQTFFQLSISDRPVIERVLDERKSEDEGGPWPRRLLLT